MKKHFLLLFGFIPLLFHAQDDSSLKKNAHIQSVNCVTASSATLTPLTSSKKTFVAKPVVQEQPSADTLSIMHSRKQIYPD
ncbi:MAG: hypothetical protein IPH78_06035 [Bacteroidetes bacterium]|nr:hypothetical protein [Bacteroidota bacterium]MBK8657456.1 hypothetical protein [Bacteroidota bacterium]